LLEAVCTGQTYLPTIVFILKGYKDMKAFIYLVTYNLMFVVPLFVIFLFALFGATSVQFSRFMKDKLGAIKILMSLLFLGLGIYLIWRG
jgi:cytochrome c biogenesis protein CcdA